MSDNKKMSKEQLQINLAEIEKELQIKKNKAIIEYCDSNNPYKIGDTFTDHIGTILIENIKYDCQSFFGYSCVYFGCELKKDGTPKKSNQKRNAWQRNEIKNNLGNNEKQ